MWEREQGRAGGRRSAVGSSGKAPRRRQLESGRRASRGRWRGSAKPRREEAKALRAGGGRAGTSLLRFFDLFAATFSPPAARRGKHATPVARQVRRSSGRLPALWSLLFARFSSREELVVGVFRDVPGSGLITCCLGNCSFGAFIHWL